MLRVIGWDDPRCIIPLKSALSMWQQATGTPYEVSVRPLTAFNDQPILDLANVCDIMIIDHPHVPDAVATGAVVPLDEFITAGDLDEIRNDTIGANYDCYVVNGRPYALHSDAACHVSAYRSQVLERIDERVPKSFADVVSLEKRRPGSVAWPLYHTDAISSLLSLIAADSAGPGASGGFVRDRSAGVRAVQSMATLAELMPDYCWTSTPQDVFRRAESDARIGYVPFAFSYLRVCLEQGDGGWRLGAPPSPSGSILGGAGMAVSSRSQDIEGAAKFAAWFCKPRTLTDLVNAGAQSGSRLAWTSPSGNQRVDDFFRDVLPVMKSAWVRPKLTWWPRAQIAAGQALVSGLRTGIEAERIIDNIETAYVQASRANQECA